MNEKPRSPDVVAHPGRVSREDREARTGHRAATLWMTGLSASGKSTIASLLEHRLFQAGAAVFWLDGDNVRHGLNGDLGFTAAARQENIRRVAEVSRLFNDAGLIVIASFISPFLADRENARRIIGPERFIEVYVEASLAVCEARDPKGLYQRARTGAVAEFTGISSPYEPPVAPQVVLPTATMAAAACAEALHQWLINHGIVSAPG